MVALLEITDAGNAFVCGGSLIDSRAVLTAAHCISGKDVTQLLVSVGQWDASTSSDLYPDTNIPVIKMIIHPEYNSNNLCNDIGLLILDTEADLSLPHVGVTCLPTTSGIHIII